MTACAFWYWVFARLSAFAACSMAAFRRCSDEPQSTE